MRTKKLIKSSTIALAQECIERELGYSPHDTFVNEYYGLYNDEVSLQVSLVRLRRISSYEALISSLWTSSEYRKRGFARMLLSDVMQRNPNVKVFRAYVASENLASMKVFELLGFVKICQISVKEKKFNLMLKSL